MNEVIRWLESYEGESWSRRFHTKDDSFHSMLICVKNGDTWVPIWSTAFPWGFKYATSK